MTARISLDIKRLMFSSSLASLCHFKTYSLLTSAFTNSNSFNFKDLPSSTDFIVFCLNLLLTAIVIYVVSKSLFDPAISSRFKKSIALTTVTIALTVAFFGIISIFGFASGPFYQTVKLFIQANMASAVVITLIIAIASVVLTTLAIRHRHTLIRYVTMAIIVVSPFSLVQIGQSLRYALFIAPSSVAQHDVPFQKQLIQGGKTKVVVFIFDELDYRLSFVDRPEGLQLNELDRLKKESVFFTNAFPPADNTLFSIAALTSGIMVKHAKPLNKDDILFTTLDGRSINWSNFPNLFGRLKQHGASSTVLASYLPYCRVMGKDIEECKWYDMATQTNSTGNTFYEKLINQNRALIETPSLSFFGQSIVIKEDVARFKHFINDANTILANDNHDLVYIHFPIPHSPHFYDRKKREFSLSNNRFSGYADSLALVDKTIGDLRKLMEEKGIWERTVVVITADHWNRYSTQFDGKKDQRVPLLIKLPRDTTEMIYDSPISTILLADLIINLENKNISSREDMLKFISNNGHFLKPVYIGGAHLP